MVHAAFQKRLSDKVSMAEDIIYRFLPEETGYQKTVLRAMNYTMKAGGKRLRPLLMSETYHIFGGTEELVHPFMAAIEMIHTYSLIHDDLPALDNDDYRRGRPTAHKMFGEAMAILAGDALLNYAFEVAASAFVKYPSDARIAKALMILASKPGIYGMIGGQTADVELTGKKVGREEMAFIYENKTGALIEASMMIGAVLAGAAQKDVDTIGELASKVGLAFQIQDDILDVVGEQEKLGKPIGSDEKNEKVTYVTHYGLPEAKAKVKALSDEALTLLTAYDSGASDLRDMIIWLTDRDK